MTLAAMLNTDKNALICDFAETYNIYTLESLPVDTVAILACGLRENSRIKMKLAGVKVAPDILLLAHAVDRLSVLVWQRTKDGHKGRKKPVSFVEELTGKSKTEKKTITVSAFDTPEEFERTRRAIIEKARARDNG